MGTGTGTWTETGTRTGTGTETAETTAAAAKEEDSSLRVAGVEPEAERAHEAQLPVRTSRAPSSAATHRSDY